MSTNANDIYQILLDSLKIQADKYKIIIDADMPHLERKDLDTEIKQMYELLSQMTNSTIILSSSEIESLKTQFQTKLQELQTILDNPNITTVKGADGKDGTNGIDGQNGLDGKDFTFDMFTPEQLVLLKGEKGQDGTNGIKGQNGIDGKDFTFDMFTPEQLSSLKGADGQNGVNGQDGQSLTFDMLTPEQKASLKGSDGKDFTFDMFTPEQLASLKGADGLSLTYESLTDEQKEDLASHVTVLGSGGSSETSSITIDDIEGLGQVIGDLYTKHSEQEQKFAGINLSEFYQNTQGRLGELNGKVLPLFSALFGVYEEDEETGQQILIQEGLIDKFNALYAQVNPSQVN